MAIDLNVVADEMFNMVKEAKGVKKYRPGEVLKAIQKKYQDQGISKKDCKEAMRVLIDSERLVYTFHSGSFVELPGDDPAAIDR